MPTREHGPLKTSLRRTVEDAARHYELGYPQECDADYLAVMRGPLDRIATLHR